MLYKWGSVVFINMNPITMLWMNTYLIIGISNGGSCPNSSYSKILK